MDKFVFVPYVWKGKCKLDQCEYETAFANGILDSSLKKNKANKHRQGKVTKALKNPYLGHMENLNWVISNSSATGTNANERQQIVRSFVIACMANRNVPWLPFFYSTRNQTET